MAVTVQNKPDSGVVLFRVHGEVLRPSVWPLDEFLLQPAETHYCFIRVPTVKDPSGRALVLGDDARDEVPVSKAVSMGFTSYDILSSPTRCGGEINGVIISAGVVEDDEGIIFKAT